MDLKGTSKVAQLVLVSGGARDKNRFPHGCGARWLWMTKV